MSMCSRRESRRSWRELGKVKLTWRYCRDTLCSRTVVALPLNTCWLRDHDFFFSNFNLLNTLTLSVVTIFIKFYCWWYLGFCVLITPHQTLIWSSLFCIESEGGAGGDEARLIARLVLLFSRPYKYPRLLAVPAYSTPLCVPCSCKNANRACVDYDVIPLIAYFEHAQQQSTFF